MTPDRDASQRRLYLHVGLPKTGTTSMQMWFLDHAGELRRHGIVYPTEPALHNYKQGYVVPVLRNDPELRNIGAALDTAAGADVLISNEGLSNHFHDFPEAHLARFREMTADWHVVLILFRRDPERWLASYYRQAVLNPANGSSELWGTSEPLDTIRGHTRIRRLLAHETLLRDMAAGFGATEAHLPDFDQPGAFARMLSLMGLTELSHLPLPRVNEAVPDWVVTLMRHINGQVPDNAVRQAWKGLLYNFLNSNHTVLRDDARDMTPEALARIDPRMLSGLPPEVPVAALTRYVAADPRTLHHAEQGT